MPERAAVESGDACGVQPRASCARARVVTGWRTPQGWPRRRTGPALWATASGVQPRSGVTWIFGAAEYAPKKYSAGARNNCWGLGRDRRVKPRPEEAEGGAGRVGTAATAGGEKGASTKAECIRERRLRDAPRTASTTDRPARDDASRGKAGALPDGARHRKSGARGRQRRGPRPRTDGHGAWRVQGRLRPCPRSRGLAAPAPGPERERRHRRRRRGPRRPLSLIHI